MREFQLVRYLRRWWWMIAVLSAISGILFYSFISSRQTYRAQTMIEFTNAQAEEGLYPSGDKIDVQEIRSSSVISNALSSIGVNSGVDAVRSRVSIAEYLTDEQKAIQTVKWNNGEAYELFPTQYIITYTSSTQESSTDARRILEAIVDSYIQLYSEKYVSITKVPNSVESLQNLNYDYIEWAEIIDEFIKLDRDYLQKMKGMRTEYRSSNTGYSFQDLYNEYNLIYSVYLPSLYSTIMNYHVTRNREMLIARYQYRIDQNNLNIKTYEEALSLVTEMIESYTEKNHDTMDYHWRSDQDESEAATGALGNRYVLGQVYDFEGRSNYKPEEITYDSVLQRYINLRGDISLKEIDNDYCSYVLSSFVDSYTEASASQIQEVEDLINLIENKLKTLDILLTATAAEHSEVETIRNVRVRSTVNVSEMTNVKLYTMMIVVVFFVFGVIGAIVVGRSLDFVDYRFYTDPSTDLPNRMRCDMEIEKYSKKVLSFPFTCAVIALTNMNEINAAVGRDAGNETLRIFADYIKECAEDYGFVGYNGGLQFLCIFPDCSRERATFYQNLLQRTVGEFNRGGHGVKIRYKLAIITASEETPLSMRELLSSTMQQLRLAKENTFEDDQDAKGPKKPEETAPVKEEKKNIEPPKQAAEAVSSPAKKHQKVLGQNEKTSEAPIKTEEKKTGETNAVEKIAESPKAEETKTEEKKAENSLPAREEENSDDSPRKKGLLNPFSRKKEKTPTENQTAEKKSDSDTEKKKTDSAFSFVKSLRIFQPEAKEESGEIAKTETVKPKSRLIKGKKAEENKTEDMAVGKKAEDSKDEEPLPVRNEEKCESSPLKKSLLNPSIRRKEKTMPENPTPEKTTDSNTEKKNPDDTFSYVKSRYNIQPEPEEKTVLTPKTETVKSTPELKKEEEDTKKKKKTKKE